VDLKPWNPFWRQLPVYSPVTLGSVFAGLASVVAHKDLLEPLRELLRAEYGSEHLLLTDSGTSALRLAIEMGLAKSGSDIVALPAYCCFDVATAAVGAKARIALYDVRADTLGPDFVSLRRALEAGARTVVIAHLYGIPVHVNQSLDLAGEFAAVLIEDAAQGAGGFWKRRPLGSWGDFGVLSFGRGKGRTGGAGGALLANTSVGVSMLQSMPAIQSGSRTGGLAILKLAAQWAFGRPSLYGLPAALPQLGLGDTVYKEPWEPSEMAPGPAAALLANWEASRREEAARRQFATDWIRRSAGKRLWPQTGIELSARSDSTGGFLRLPFLAVSSERNDSNPRAGFARGYPQCLAELEPIQDRLLPLGDLRGAQEIVNRLRTAPVHRWARQDWRDD